MENLILIFNTYFDIIFARNPSATVEMAIALTFCTFFLIYLIVVVPAYFLSKYLSTQNQLSHRKLHPQQVKKELVSSFLSITMFSILGGIAFYLFKAQWLTVTGSVSFTRWIGEVFLLYIWNEVHFYISHRALHTRWLYRHVHIEHHRSVRVTPLSTWRFHWFEALLLGSVLPLALVFHAFSVWSLMMLPLISITWNIIGHSNWKTRLPFIGNASKQHELHHNKLNGNYGFSTMLIDKLFGTRIEKFDNPSVQ